MTDRFSEIEKPFRSPPSWEARRKEYPERRAQIETLLCIIENAGGDVEKASQAEPRIIEEMRPMGNEVRHGWARRQQQRRRRVTPSPASIVRKKPSTGSPDWEESKSKSRSSPAADGGRRFAPFPNRQKCRVGSARRRGNEPSSIRGRMIPWREHR